MHNDTQARLPAILPALALPPDISMRTWNEADFPAIQRLSDAAGWPTPSQRPDDALSAWYASCPTLVVTSDEELIGFVRAMTDGAVTMYIGELLVTPAWQGQGVGTALLDACHLLFPTTRIDLLSTEAADAFYQAQGFRSFRGFRKSYC